MSKRPTLLEVAKLLREANLAVSKVTTRGEDFEIDEFDAAKQDLRLALSLWDEAHDGKSVNRTIDLVRDKAIRSKSIEQAVARKFLS